MIVLEGRIVGVFGSEDKGSEEDTVEGPVFSLDREMRFGSVDVDEGYQYGGHLDVRGVQDVRDEVHKVGTLLGAPVGPATGGGGSAECEVNCFRSLLDQMVLSERFRWVLEV